MKKLFAMSLLAMGLSSCSKPPVSTVEMVGNPVYSLGENKLEIIIKNNDVIDISMDNNNSEDEAKILQDGNDLVIEDNKNNAIYLIKCPEGKASNVIVTCGQFTNSMGHIVVRSVGLKGKKPTYAYIAK